MKLSNREREVLELIYSGNGRYRTNKEIAAILGKSPKTVENQMTSAMMKLGVHTRTEAALRVMETA